MKLISIIVPVYNVEQYIRKCLDSIAEQTYKNIEIILVDDGSPDSCGAICDEYARRDKRIRVIHRENGGLSAARNTGLDDAKGDYIMFVDSDDYITPDAVQLLMSCAEENSSDITVGGFEYCDTNGNIYQTDRLFAPEGRISKDDFWHYFYTDPRTYYVTMWAKLFKSSLWKTLRFPVGKLHEDEFVIHNLIDSCECISLFRKPVYYYVQRGGSIVNTKFTLKNLDSSEAILLRCRYFIEKHNTVLAAKTLTHAMYNLLRVQLLSKEEKKAGKKRIRELYREFRRLYVKLIFKKSDFRSKCKCSIFCISPNIFMILKDLSARFWKFIGNTKRG